MGCLGRCHLRLVGVLDGLGGRFLRRLQRFLVTDLGTPERRRTVRLGRSHGIDMLAGDPPQRVRPRHRRRSERLGPCDGRHAQRLGPLELAVGHVHRRVHGLVVRLVCHPQGFRRERLQAEVVHRAAEEHRGDLPLVALLARELVASDVEQLDVFGQRRPL